MTFSGTRQPDLDWSHVRETVKLLAVSVAQVKASMKAGDRSIDELAKSFTEMVDDMAAINNILTALPISAERDDALRNCVGMQDKIYASIVAFQFYDRLQQRLQHVSLGLKELSALIGNPNRLYNPTEWMKFQQEIRGCYTMESEKIMFDAIHEGKSIEQALALVHISENQLADNDEVELF
ncbi:hypothetical protein [Methylomonas sp. MgM2]